ncbi:MAG TPA: methyl-accepting chemotaxis protein [Micromonosporaceae bacterium]|nr:methyl-accepting chemotaxis protein [Micromonosporaceae bacterium]
MIRTTFRQKVAIGFGASLVLTVAIGAVSILALRAVVASKDEVIRTFTDRTLQAERLNLAAETKVTAGRTYLLTRDEQDVVRMHRAQEELLARISSLRADVEQQQARDLLDELAAAEAAHQRALDGVIQMRRDGVDLDEVAKAFEERAAPARDEMNTKITALTALMDAEQQAAHKRSDIDASRANGAVVTLAALAVAVVAALAFLLTRTLRRQVATVVGHVQTSSAELEAVASQQAAGAKEEATAMNEITTTINELLVTSRQISDSARQVAQIAADTATAARAGDTTVGQAGESIAGIREQVNLIVGHMLELGEKSQQIGAIVDIVSELAEQTNILSINATIEATGAGEAGRRFATVADEIRKLADRVTDSAKEIRSLIDDVRGAVNTTVMATEAGSKGVDAGFRRFTDVAASFQQIVDMVVSTTDAAREIELSTKQQTTAVEQVNVAVVDVARATRATEATSTQTQQTAAQLAGLSRDLLQLVHTGADR